MAALSVIILFSPSNGGGGMPFPGADKVVHLVLFALLAGTARRRFGGRTVLAVLVSYAVASEVVQGVLMETRSGDPLDGVADLLGVAVGWLMARRRRVG